MENPLLSQGALPSFSNILPEHIEPAVKQVISQNRAELVLLLEGEKNFTWETLFVPLQEMSDRLAKVWSPVSHLHAVMQSEELRKAYNLCQPLLTEYYTELLQNEKLFKSIQQLTKDPGFNMLDQAQQKVIENELRDFKLAGVHLPPEGKAKFAELQKTLNKLTTEFAENILDATQGWTLHVTDPLALKGLPEQNIKTAEENAKQAGKKGWVFTLEYPCYSGVMKYLENRELRWLMYEAYVTRASDQGPNAGQWDNTPLIDNILKIRHEMARLLGFANFAEYSLATKMADTPERVLKFLEDLMNRSKPFALQEVKELENFALTQKGQKGMPLEAWDYAFYTEKLREEKYALTQEALRPYFPVDKVIAGMFEVFHAIFGIKIIEQHGMDTWHPQVQLFAIYDENEVLRGYFYTDLYARPNKRDGAWMDDCRVRHRLPDGSVQQPVAFLTCNFARPLGDKGALLTHEDVQTLFHEFGHCLHHLLTQVNYSFVSGINGVPWDAVEFPSQLMEYWCWEKEALAKISGHVDTGEALPDGLYTKLIASKNFQSGMQMLRQLEFSLFDFRIHLEYDLKKQFDVQAMLDQVRQHVSVVKVPGFNRFQQSFSHIFAGGYAAGYYSYKWAEVLSSDAFSSFEEKGIFDHDTGRLFLHTILEKGGSEHPMDLFVAFKGREPKIDALLRHSGFKEKS